VRRWPRWSWWGSGAGSAGTSSTGSPSIEMDFTEKLLRKPIFQCEIAKMIFIINTFSIHQRALLPWQCSDIINLDFLTTVFLYLVVTLA
jgi:hypothetical protein